MLIVLMALCLNGLIFLFLYKAIALPFYLLFCFLLYKKIGWQKTLFLQGCFFVLIILRLRIPTYQIESVVEGTVIQQNTSSYLLQTKKGKVLVQSEQLKKIGNNVKIEVEEQPLSSPRNFNAFNYQHYCYSEGVFYQVKEIKELENDQHLSLLQHLLNYIETFKQEKVMAYTKAFLLGVKDETMKEVLESGQQLSLVHLFALSGMHLTLLENVLEKFKIPKKIRMVLLGGYVLLIQSGVSLWRAYGMVILKEVTKEKYDDLTLLALLSLLFCIVNPYLIYSLSYLYSFVISAFIILAKGLKGASCYPYLAGIPLLIQSQSCFNPISFALMFLLNEGIAVLYHLTLVNFLLLGKTSGLIEFLFVGFSWLLNGLSQLKFEVIVPRSNGLFILGWYVCLLWILFKHQRNLSFYKPMTCLFVLFLLQYSLPYFNLTSKVVMIDVGQGDCFLIQMAFNQGNYLIDTGGNKSYDLATKRIIPYLKSIGIRQLDGLILTHDDYDHNGASESLIQNFKIKNVIDQGQDIGPLKYLDSFTSSDTTNDQSLVYTLKIGKVNYLFTGDISSEVEKKIIEHYPDLKVNILKVSHHGSKTASSSPFLSYYHPQIGLISCGKNNLYHHPHSEVMERLEAYGIKTYRSDELGMVEIHQFLNGSTYLRWCYHEK